MAAIELSKHINAKDAKALFSRLSNSEKRLEKTKDMAESNANMILGYLAGGATGFGIGYLETEHGGIAYRGVPGPLILAGVTGIAAIFFTRPDGVARGLIQHVSHASFVSYTHTMGQAHAMEAKKLAMAKAA